MKSYVIYLPKSELSTKSANNVIDVAKKVGNVEVELWEGVDKFQAESLLEKYQYLPDIHRFTAFSYFEPALGCFFSHHSLWEESVRTNERIMILEHDALFYKEFIDCEFEGVLNIGKPLWGFRNWDESPNGLLERDCNNEHNFFNTRDHNYCQCDTSFLYGAHAYIVTPKVSEMLLEKAKIEIVPADCFIESHRHAKMRIPVADYLPHCVEQVQEFSLIQRATEVQDWWASREDFVFGKKAWDEYKNTTTIKGISTDGNRVVVRKLKE